MKELDHVRRQARRLLEANQSFALATVVEVGGSTYRRPGARMLVDPAGQRWGTLSGGCLEGEVTQQALEVLETGQPRLLPFDMSDEERIIGFGAGCNGVVNIYIEAVPLAGRANPIDLLDACLNGRQRGILVTVLDAQDTAEDVQGRRFLALEDGPIQGDLDAESSRYAALLEQARQYLNTDPQGRQRHLWAVHRFELDEGYLEALFEVVRPPVRLVIFGEGHDVPPLVAFAKGLGWRVAVVGRKSVDVLIDRFPEADEHIFLMHPEEALQYAPVDARTAVLVMNHTYVRDRDLLRTLLSSAAPYIGVLGPQERTNRMLDEIRTADGDGTLASEDRFARVYGPVGLDISTETPEEIALAAVAEVQAVLHGHRGGFLRDVDAPIHGARSERTLSIS